MLPLRYDSNCNYSYGCSQREPFYSRLVGPHTIFLCRCDFLLSLADLSFALGSYPLQLIVIGILTRATIDPISKHMICDEVLNCASSFTYLCSRSVTTAIAIIAMAVLNENLSFPD